MFSKILMFTLFVIFFIYKFIVRFILPVIRLPKPTGNFAIGVISYYMKDENRQEVHSNNSQDKREIVVQIWYPIDNNKNNSQKSFYMADISRVIHEGLHNLTRIPAIFWRYFLKVQTNAQASVFISQKENKYPIAVFSHGLGGVCSLNTANIEELVSHGYIVIGINHTYSSYVTSFPDGRDIYIDNKLRIPLRQLIKENLKEQLDYIKKELEIWVDDVKFVISEMEKINQNKNNLLFNKLDFNRMGIFGHSLGGALAAEICRQDNRFKMGISLDGSIIDETADLGFSKPFMFIVGTLLGDNLYPTDRKLEFLKINKLNWDEFIEKYRKNILDLCSKIGDHAYYIVIPGAGHFSFTDIALISSLINRYIDFDLGDINSENITKITNFYIVNFFDKYLKSKEIDIPNKCFHKELSSKLSFKKKVYTEVKKYLGARK